MMGGGIVTAYDPYFEQVIALVHADGTNGATTITDSSQFAATFTGASGATLSTAGPKFGTGALTTVAGSQFASGTSVDVGAGADMTVEAFFNPTSVSAVGVIFQHGVITTTGYELYHNANGSVALFIANANAGTSAAGVLVAGAYHHIALTRRRQLWQVWIDGVLVLSTGVNGHMSVTGVLYLGIAGYSPLGKFDEFRYTTNLARYTTTFTPPVAAFPDASAAASTYATWDASAKSANVTLSGGNLVATGNGVAQNEQFRGTVCVGSGKWYWEQKGANCAGIANALAGLTDGNYPGQTINSVSYNQSGAIYANGGTVATVSGCVGTDIIGIALDMTTKTVTFYKNNVLLYAYVHSVPGAIYPLSTVYGGVAGPCTANFGASAQTYSPPAGFSPGPRSTTQYATWDQSRTKTGVTLTNGKLTMTAPALSTATLGKSSGKWFWEVTMGTNTNYNSVAVVNSVFDVNTRSFAGDDANSWGYYSNGQLYTSNAGTAYGSAFGTAGDVIGVALNADNGTVSFYKNGVYQGLGYAGLSGPLYPANGYGYAGSGPTGQHTANFGATPFKYTIPDGYLPGLSDATPAAPLAYATFDPANKGAHLTLSNGNLSYSTSYASGSYHSTRSTIGKTTGKWYWEVTQTAYGLGGVPSMIGIATEANPMATVDGFSYPAPSAGHGIGWYGGTGIMYSDGANIGSPGTYVPGDLIGIALDAATRTAFFYKNGAPVTSVVITGSDAIYPAVGYSAQGTANFGQAPFKYPVPAGFNAGIYNAPTPFTLTIAASRAAFDLRTLAISSGWDGVGALTLVINAGVNITSSSAAIPAITITGSFAGGVTFTNNGNVYGMGGSPQYTANTAGNPGGVALAASVPVAITNNGLMAGGGGGGGGGGTGRNFDASVTYTGAAGGTGAYAGVAATAGSLSSDPNTSNVYGGPGSGHGKGGTGGAVGTAGFAGYNGYNGVAGNDYMAGGAGGLAGKSRTGNAYINWLVAGTLTGPFTS
jgi:hypothetical protein